MPKNSPSKTKRPVTPNYNAKICQGKRKKIKSSKTKTPVKTGVLVLFVAQGFNRAFERGLARGINAEDKSNRAGDQKPQKRRQDRKTESPRKPHELRENKADRD